MGTFLTSESSCRGSAMGPGLPSGAGRETRRGSGPWNAPHGWGGGRYAPDLWGSARVGCDRSRRAGTLGLDDLAIEGGARATTGALHRLPVPSEDPITPAGQ